MSGLLDALSQTWPARLAQDLWSGVTLPRDVYQGKVNPLDADAIGRATNMAMLPMMGTFAGAPAGAVGAGPVRQGIRAYHGSPHDFEKFDLSKIGTGEGAQAYGHGLYFAEAEPVARMYRDNLARPDFTRTKSGVGISSDLQRILEDAYNDAMNNHGVRSPSGNDAVFLAGKNLDRQRADALKAKDFDWYQKIADQQTELARMGNDAPKFGGKMYEVNINAKPEQFLDWDKPLGQQPQIIDAIKGSPINKALEQRGFAGGIEGMNPQRGAPGVYDQIGLAINRGQDFRTAGSQALSEAGIHGIKYLDQGSRANALAPAFRAYSEGDKYFVSAGRTPRAAGPFATEAEANSWIGNQGTSNYVVFNDQLIDILRKYGLAGLAAIPPAALSGLPIASQQQAPELSQ